MKKKLNSETFNKFESLKLKNVETSKVMGGRGETCSNITTSHFTADVDKQDSDTEQASDPENATM